ncbi:MAG: hypothetical protein ACRDKT_02430 [Actinomycetota bacterium]
MKGILLFVAGLVALAWQLPATAQERPRPVPRSSSEVPITLEASAPRVTAGQEITLSGVLHAPQQECVRGKTIFVQRTVHGTGLQDGFTLDVSDEEGNFSGTVPGQVSADYEAIMDNRGSDCTAELSKPVTVLVRVRVGARAVSDRVPKGMQGAIVGIVEPGHPGTRVTLQRRADGTWRNIRRATLDDTSQFRFTFKVSWNRRRVFRVIWKAQDEDHVAGRSARIRILSVPRP